jgi:hypothetical protein
MWSALLGAIVGGFFALAGGLLVAVRADRRVPIGAARLIVAQLERSSVELAMLVHEGYEEDESEPWYEGSHLAIRTDAWDSQPAAFVGTMSEETFHIVEDLHRQLAWAGEYGFTRREGYDLRGPIDKALERLQPLTRATWADKYLFFLWKLYIDVAAAVDSCVCRVIFQPET